MGIGLSNANWFDVVQQTRKDDRERMAKGYPSKLRPEKFGDTNNISKISTEWIQAHCTKYDDNDKPLPSTDRAKRRRFKRTGK